jgi:integrase
VQAKARELQRLIDEGIDPRSLKRKAKATAIAEKTQAESKRAQEALEAVTFGQAWAAYVSERKPHWGALSLRDHVAMIDEGGKPKTRGKGLTKPAPLAPFLATRLMDIDADAVQAWAAYEAQTRPTRARLALNLLGGFFNWCSEHDGYAPLMPNSNPAQSKRAREHFGKPKAKQDALLKEQLPAWFAAVKGLQAPAASAYLQCALLTGARPNELLQLRWEDVNTKWNSLTIRDKDESKGGKDGVRIIPLTPYVKHLIQALPKRGNWVFSSEDGAQPIYKPNRRLTEVCKVAGIEHLTIHGLRRSFGSLAEWLELPAGIVAQIQGHKPSATAEKHYRVRPLDLLRLHHEKLEAWILEQAGLPFDPETASGKLKLIKIA